VNNDVCPSSRIIGILSPAAARQPRGLPVAFLLRLHQTIGNRAVANLLTPQPAAPAHSTAATERSARASGSTWRKRLASAVRYFATRKMSTIQLGRRWRT
jgi:hypothetical protein